MLLGKDACPSVRLQTGAEQLLRTCRVALWGEHRAGTRGLGALQLPAAMGQGPGLQGKDWSWRWLPYWPKVPACLLPVEIPGLTSQITRVLDKKAGHEVPSSLSFLQCEMGGRRAFA